MEGAIFVFLDSVRIPCEPGHRLLDFIDEIEPPPLPTACRAAHCGACLVRVELGDAALVSAAEDERETLLALGASPGDRLGCQLVLRESQGEVRLRRVPAR